MMRNIVFVMLGVVLWVTGAAAASAPVCAPYAKPIVLDFKTDTTPPIYNNNLNVSGIRNLFRMRGQALGGPHERALGITYVETVLNLNGSSSLVPREGGYCVYLNTVGANFGWQRLEVFVAAELAKESCGYRAVLDHENQHVSLNRSTLMEFAPKVRARLEEVLLSQQPFFTRATEGSTDAMLAQIHGSLKTILDQFRDTMAARNGTIDTAHNYGATAALCNDWGDTNKTRRN